MTEHAEAAVGRPPEKWNSDSDRLIKIREFFEEKHPVILKGFGHTYQWATLAEHGGDLYHDTNVFLAGRAGLRPGMHVLDAGCGACGPAVDIAQHINGLTVEAVTVSSAQAAAARAHIQVHHLADRIHVHVNDYHQLPFQEETFDAAYFFESASYSENQVLLFRETLRVLKPGGLLYVKDGFIEPGPLSAVQTQALIEVNQKYVLNFCSLNDAIQAVATAGFAQVRGAGTTLFDTIPWHTAMTRQQNRARCAVDLGQSTLTDLGQTHEYPLAEQGVTPICVGEVWAVRPPAHDLAESS